MIRNAAFRRLSPYPSERLFCRQARPRQRLSSTKSAENLASQTSEKARSRIHRIQARLPRFLQSYTTPLLNAPFTHISSFLLLHEITAIVPLFGLAGLFHYTRWLPPFISEGKWVADGLDKFGKWFRKKGWLGDMNEHGAVNAKKGVWWGRGEGGVRIVVE